MEGKAAVGVRLVATSEFLVAESSARDKDDHDAGASFPSCLAKPVTRDAGSLGDVDGHGNGDDPEL